MAPTQLPLPAPSPAPQSILTSSQVPRDEAEEEADDVTQELLAAMLALVQPRCGTLGQARGLAVAHHPGAWLTPWVSLSCFLSCYTTPPSLSLLCLPFPNWTLRTFLLELLSPLLLVSPSVSPVGLSLFLDVSTALAFFPSSVLCPYLLLSGPFPALLPGVSLLKQGKTDPSPAAWPLRPKAQSSGGRRAAASCGGKGGALPSVSNTNEKVPPV